MPANSKLLPCPFCKGEAKGFWPEEITGLNQEVQCTKCKAKVYGSDKKKVIEAWNTRAQSTPVTSNVGDDVIETMQRDFVDVLRAYKGYEHLWSVLPPHFGIFDVFYKTGSGQTWCIRVAANDEKHAISLVIGVPGGRDRKLEKCINVFATSEADLANAGGTKCIDAKQAQIDYLDGKLAIAEADLAKAREVIAELVEAGVECREILKGLRSALKSARVPATKMYSAIESARTWLAANPKMGG